MLSGICKSIMMSKEASGSALMQIESGMRKTWNNYYTSGNIVEMNQGIMNFKFKYKVQKW